ncbi:hypothetical protein LWC34_19390 [Kibdelosporangium philippinense]|uniref:Peptidase M14 carboxypeptidase A domain-containing protein n=1 Tax=Kibdelosporangium philippinense TaxID=211113 RepID=A0ABS8ZCP7_9PSEU|nr:hypothetical protein [Kibdelosporangium philippinense]MCE7004974.1 hypothetical protein [Kibdelosporangium philippinense]
MSVGFPGPDDVSAGLAKYSELREVGTSRLGEPITMISIGDGPRNALVFAGPHPNEPIGFLTVLALAETVSENDLGHTWHIIGCVDPDGARLNESWYAGPLDRRRYLHGFYRPPFDEQVEWTFPDGLPETRALRKVIDEVRPDLMCSLHNAELGGVFYYVSEDRPGLADALATLPTGVPLHVGEAEMPGTQQIRPGVFLFPSQESVPGMSSVHYASQYGTFSLVIEVPMWSDERSADTASSGEQRVDVLATAADMIEDIDRMPDLPIADFVVQDSPFLRSYAALRPRAVHIASAMRTHATEGEATTAERFGFHETAHMLRLRACTTALRILDGELGVGNHRATIRRARQAYAELFETWLAEESAVAQPIPLDRLVGTQLGAILTAARS